MTKSSPRNSLHAVNPRGDLSLLSHHVPSEPSSSTPSQACAEAPSRYVPVTLCPGHPPPAASPRHPLSAQMGPTSPGLLLMLMGLELGAKSRNARTVSGSTSCSWPSEGWPSPAEGWLQLQNWGWNLGPAFIPCPSPEKQRTLESRVSSPGQVKPHIHPGG